MKGKILFIIFIFIFYLYSQSISQVIDESDFEIEKKVALKEYGFDEDEVQFYRIKCVRYNKYDGRVYVVDAGNHNITVFDEELNYITQFGQLGQGPGDLNGPRGIAFFKNGNIVISEIGNHRLQIVGKDYKSISTIRVPFKISNAYRTYIEVDSDNLIYLPLKRTRSELNLVSVFNTNGDLLKSFGDVLKHNEPVSKMAINSVVFLKDNKCNFYLFYVHDEKMKKYDSKQDLVIDTSNDNIRATRLQLDNQRKIWKKQANNYNKPGVPKLKSYIVCGSSDANYLYIHFRKDPDYGIHVFNQDLNLEKRKITLYNSEDEQVIIIDFDFENEKYIYAVDTGKQTVLKFIK